MAKPAEMSRCRLCFSADNLSDAIFPADGRPPNLSLISMIHACTSIRISVEQDFPCPICGTCLRMLEQFYEYRQRCLANDLTLRRQRGEDDDDGHVDPLEECFTVVKQEPDGDQQFYRQVKQQIQEFLQTKVKEIERMALDKLDETLQNKDRGHGLQITLSNDSNDTGQATLAWKRRYLTLQKNNELLQQAFQKQRTKLKQTEQMLKSYQQQSNNFGTINDLEESQRSVGFTTHPAIPHITPEYLYSLHVKAGAGQKGDRHFISRLAVAVFGEEVLINSSVTGRPSNSHNKIPPKPPLCPTKLSAISAKLYERVEQELGVGRSNRKELLHRSSEKVVRLVVCQKLMNLRKKRSQAGSGVGNGSAAEEEF